MTEKKQEQHKENDDKSDAKTKNSDSSFLKKFRQHPLFIDIIVISLLILTVTGIAIYSDMNSRISIESAEIYAPVISLAPATPGVLEKVHVSEGDSVGKHKIVATISGNPLKTATGGIITSVTNTPGAIFNSATPVAKMINPDELRVIGHLDEDKGLSEVQVGQRVTFTVDAYGSKKYYGVVDEVSPSSRSQDIVFSISDKREVKQFDIKVKFDVEKYPELKNGMSARMTIYKYDN
jgi:multidrug resistance efflux pump